MTTTNILLLAIFIALLSLAPQPVTTSADLEAFQKFFRWLWRAIVIMVRLVAVVIALIVACLEFGASTVMVWVTMAFVYGIFGYAAFRIILRATEFIMPEGLHRYLSEKTDSNRLLSFLDKY